MPLGLVKVLCLVEVLFGLFSFLGEGTQRWGYLGGYLFYIVPMTPEWRSLMKIERRGLLF
jgi:hypothetical protein